MKVLIVEDDEIARDLLILLLEGRDYEITACGSAEDAIIEMKHSFFPFIILDMALPKMNGCDLCLFIRQQSKGNDPYILLFTGTTLPSDLNKILKAGANDYLDKQHGYNPVILNMRLSMAEEQIRQNNRQREFSSNLCLGT